MRWLVFTCVVACSAKPPLPGAPVHEGFLNQKSGLIPADALLGDGTVDPHSAAGELGATYAAALGTFTTLEDWKRAFGFPVRALDETLAAYRDRTDVAVYYNVNELGLGRELGCVEFDDGVGVGQACFVTNYGLGFNDGAGALALAEEGASPKNTVCITRRPSFGPEHEVQFYVFGPNGTRQTWAQLDVHGPRSHPQVCTECHGGSLDTETGLVRGARFLPLYPNLVAFAEDLHETGATRARQLDRIQRMNRLALKTQLTVTQRDRLGDGAYDPSFAPAGWRGDAWQRALYAQVIAPYCSTCHDASSAAELPELYRFTSYAAFVGDRESLDRVCDFTMPNAHPTMLRFWLAPLAAAFPSAPDGHHAKTPADALLAAYGKRECPGFADAIECRREEDCGNAYSGAFCDNETRRCGTTAVCRLSASRGCQAPLRCVPQDDGPIGSDGVRYDGVCVR